MTGRTTPAWRRSALTAATVLAVLLAITVAAALTIARTVERDRQADLGAARRRGRRGDRPASGRLRRDPVCDPRAVRGAKPGHPPRISRLRAQPGCALPLPRDPGPGLLRAVPGFSRPAYEAAVRRDARLSGSPYPPGFRIRPAGLRPRHVVVSYLEPVAGQRGGLRDRHRGRAGSPRHDRAHAGQRPAGRYRTGAARYSAGPTGAGSSSTWPPATPVASSAWPAPRSAWATSCAVCCPATRWIRRGRDLRRGDGGRPHAGPALGGQPRLRPRRCPGRAACGRHRRRPGDGALAGRLRTAVGGVLRGAHPPGRTARRRWRPG